MAKAKAQTKAKAESNLIRAMLDAGRKEGPDPFSYSAKDAEKYLCGIEYPSLAMMWLTSSNVLFLSKVIGIAGPSQSQKSSLGYEMLRWFMDAGGYGDYVECEGGKYSKSLIDSVIGYDHIENDKLKIDQCASIEEAQSTVTEGLKFMAKERPGRDTLFAFLLDSLMGAETEGGYDKFFKEGSASRSFPEGAMLWTSGFKSITSALVGWPISLIFVNHLKEKPNPMPGLPPQKTTPGGVAQRFHSSVFFWVKRTGKDSKVELCQNGANIRRGHDIREMMIECDKNSFGIDGRRITVNFVFYHEDDGRQRSFFDWDAATADLLWRMCNERDKYKTVDVDALKTALGLRVDAKLYSSDPLGLKRVSASEFGHAVHANAELMARLKSLLHIRQYHVWDGTMPYTLPASKLIAPEQPTIEKHVTDLLTGSS